MIDITYIKSLVESEEYQVLDTYLMEMYQADPYDKESLITLVMWLDFNEFTWNEFAVDAMRVFLDKYPQDIEIFILYFLYSDWIGLLRKNINFSKIEELLVLAKWTQYFIFLLYIKLFWFMSSYEDESLYLNQTYYKELLDEIANLNDQSVTLHNYLTKYYHFHMKWDEMAIEIEKMKMFQKESIYWNKPILDYYTFLNSRILWRYWWVDFSSLEEALKNKTPYIKIN